MCMCVCVCFTVFGVLWCAVIVTACKSFAMFDTTLHIIGRFRLQTWAWTTPRLSSLQVSHSLYLYMVPLFAQQLPPGKKYGL